MARRFLSLANNLLPNKRMFLNTLEFSRIVHLTFTWENFNHFSHFSWSRKNEYSANVYVNTLHKNTLLGGWPPAPVKTSEYISR